jgi:hypothetical protein
MSSLGDNVFELLAGKERKSLKSEKVEVTTVPNDPDSVSSKDKSVEAAEAVEGEDAAWTVQSSVKTRRLVPQFSLSRQDLGSDNVRSKITPVVDAVKKKGLCLYRVNLSSLL